MVPIRAAPPDSTRGVIFAIAAPYDAPQAIMATAAMIFKVLRMFTRNLFIEAPLSSRAGHRDPAHASENCSQVDKIKHLSLRLRSEVHQVS
jgi:hypothetical protein